MAECTCSRDNEKIFDPHEITFDLAGATLKEPLSSGVEKDDPETYYAKLENAKLLIENKSVEEIKSMIDHEIHHMVLERLLEEEIKDGNGLLVEKLRRAIKSHDEERIHSR